MTDATEQEAEGVGAWRVSLFVEVRDPGELWEAACASFIEENPGDVPDPEQFGTFDEPDIATCLRQLADPGSSWPGTKILDSEAEGG